MPGAPLGVGRELHQKRQRSPLVTSCPWPMGRAAFWMGAGPQGWSCLSEARRPGPASPRTQHMGVSCGKRSDINGGSPLGLRSPTRRHRAPTATRPGSALHPRTRASQEVLLASGGGPFPQDLPDGPAWQSVFPSNSTGGAPGDKITKQTKVAPPKL